MDIKIIESIDDAHTATGLAVVIDVFRAFSVQAYLLANGAEKIIPIKDLDEARRLKEENPEFILLGERDGIKMEGFDYGNSPTEILNVDFSGKTIIHTTSNGTKGLIDAKNADIVLAGSFLIADSILKFIQRNDIRKVCLIATSPRANEKNEDMMLANYLKDALEGQSMSESEIREMAAQTSAYAYLFNEIGVPQSDFDLCLDINRFDFIIKKIEEGGKIYLVKENI